MRFVVHIGWHKCGSTAIQEMLTGMSGYLEQERKICYPRTGRHGLSHHPLAWAMYRMPQRSPAARGAKIVCTIDAYLESIRKETAERGCDTAVISSEEFSSTHNYDLPMLKKALGYDDVSIVAYVRRQDLLIESAYAMAVRWLKFRSRLSFEEYKTAYASVKKLDYFEYFDQWCDLFGKNNLVVRHFAQGDGWDIRSDFLKTVIGLDNSESIGDDDRTNCSLSVGQTQFLSWLNGIELDEETFDRVISYFERFPERFNPSPLRKQVFMGMEARRGFLANYAESNRKFGASYLGDERILQLKDEEIARLSGAAVPDSHQSIAAILECMGSVDPLLKKTLHRFLPTTNNGRKHMEKITHAPPEKTAANYVPLFVCGAPRSGTTLLLSLICTSRSVNLLSAECDYLTSFVHPYIVGRNRFNLHTNCYFASMEDFERYHADIMRGVMNDMWNFLDRPAKLVLKDPNMTRYANILLKLLPECRMIISIRDPKDVVASRVAIEMRRLGSISPADIGSEFIDTICREYNALHEYVITLEQQDLQRVKMVRYEQLVEGAGLSELAGFIGVDDIDAELLWQRALKMGERKSHNEWVSPLYGKKMSNESVGRYRGVLNEAEIARIDSACAHTYEKLLAIGGCIEQA